MDTTNQPAATVMGRLYAHCSGHASSTETRLLLIAALAILAHVLVKVTRRISEWLINKSQAQKNPLGFVTQQPKFITLTRLIVSGIIFVIYFFAIGLILQELFDVNLTAYLASASVVGLAISFGSQGLVQDMVIGLTLIFSDAMEAGELVEIAGTTIVIGRVEEIGLRFTKLINFIIRRCLFPTAPSPTSAGFRTAGSVRIRTSRSRRAPTAKRPPKPPRTSPGECGGNSARLS